MDTIVRSIVQELLMTIKLKFLNINSTRTKDIARESILINLFKKKKNSVKKCSKVTI